MTDQRYSIEETKGTVVVVAPKRKKRPNLQGKKTRLHLCPFCPGNESQTPPATFQLPGGKWKVRAFANKFAFFNPSLHFNPELNGSPAFGMHEVITESPKHSEQFENFSKQQLTLVYKAYVNRFLALSTTNEIEYVYLFRNHGKEGGASIPHEHGQIVGLPFIPEIPRKEMEHFEHYRRSTGKCFYCELAEKKQNKIFENRDFICLRPNFARFGLESWIIPKKHGADFTTLDKKQAENFMLALKEITRRLKKSTENYNVAFHCSGKMRKIHWHIEVYPRTDTLAALELGAGIIVNPRDVKEAVKELR